MSSNWTSGYDVPDPLQSSLRIVARALFASGRMEANSFQRLRELGCGAVLNGMHAMPLPPSRISSERHTEMTNLFWFSFPPSLVYHGPFSPTKPTCEQV